MADEFEIVEHFLSSRGISREVTRQLREENVGIEVLSVMSDDDMQRLGISRLGDRIALRVFCQIKQGTNTASTSSGNSSTLSSTDHLLARLKEKMNQGRANKPKTQSHLTGNKFATKTSRRIEVGWLHYDRNISQFRQVREKSGGGTRKLVIPGSSDMGTILKYAKDLFFPNGKSNKGKIEDFAFEIANFDCNPLEQTMTVEDAYTTSKVRLLRLYLRSERVGLVHTSSTSTETTCQEKEQDDDLPDLTPPHEAWTVDTGTPSISFRIRATGQNCVPDLQPRGACVPSTSRTEATAIEDVCTKGAYEEYIDLVGDDGEDDEDEHLQDALMNSLVSDSSSSGPSAPAKVNAKEILQSFQANYFQDNTGSVNTIVISRRKLLMSVKRALAKSDFSFSSTVKVCFSGEDAEDEGGPKREFFTLLMKTISSEMGLLEGMPMKQLLTHNIELLRQGQYHLAGQLVAWSIANGGPGLACLSSHMISLMCGESVSDLSAAAQHIPDDTFRSIVLEILSVKSETEMTSAVHKWSSQLMDNGVVNQHRLSLKDKDTVAGDLIKNHLQFRISAELSQFTTGLGELWSLFVANPGVLKDIFLFNEVSISFQRLRQLYTINWAEQGSHRRTQQEDAIFNFETFLQDCESGTICIALSAVLAFWTGAEVEPPLGFQTTALMMHDRQSSSDKPLLVDFYDDAGRLPYASTCALCLWLPVNVTEDVFQASLVRSFTECVGFGKV